jgi:hypothetical protein
MVVMLLGLRPFYRRNPPGASYFPAVKRIAAGREKPYRPRKNSGGGYFF